MKAILTAVMTGTLLLAGAVYAADEKPADTAKAEDKAEMKKAVRHDHMEANKQGVAAPAPKKAAGEKKPLHDHRKENK